MSGPAFRVTEQRAAVRIAHRQSAVRFAIWTVSAVVFALVNLDAGAAISCLAASVILIGAVVTSCIGFLVSQRALRPITAAALKSTAANAPMPGVLARLIIVKHGQRERPVVVVVVVVA